MLVNLFAIIFAMWGGEIGIERSLVVEPITSYSAYYNPSNLLSENFEFGVSYSTDNSYSAGIVLPAVFTGIGIGGAFLKNEGVKLGITLPGFYEGFKLGIGGGIGFGENNSFFSIGTKEYYGNLTFGTIYELKFKRDSLESGDSTFTRREIGLGVSYSDNENSMEINVKSDPWNFKDHLKFNLQIERRMEFVSLSGGIGKIDIFQGNAFWDIGLNFHVKSFCIGVFYTEYLEDAEKKEKLSIGFISN